MRCNLDRSFQKVIFDQRLKADLYLKGYKEKSLTYTRFQKSDIQLLLNISLNYICVAMNITLQKIIQSTISIWWRVRFLVFKATSLSVSLVLLSCFPNFHSWYSVNPFLYLKLSLSRYKWSSLFVSLFVHLSLHPSSMLPRQPSFVAAVSPQLWSSITLLLLTSWRSVVVVVPGKSPCSLPYIDLYWQHLLIFLGTAAAI